VDGYRYSAEIPMEMGALPLESITFTAHYMVFEPHWTRQGLDTWASIP
jgi:hypothetical protein